MEEFKPKVITHNLNKHGIRDVTICSTKEEYIAKIKDIFEEHETEGTFSRLQEHCYLEEEQIHKDLVQDKEHFQELSDLAIWKGNSYIHSFRDTLCEDENNSMKRLKQLKYYVDDYKLAKNGNVKAILDLLYNINEFNSNYEFYVD